MEPSFEILPFKRIFSFNLNEGSEGCICEGKEFCNVTRVNKYLSLLSLFCEFSRDHAIKIFIFKKKEIKLLTKEQQEPYKNAKICFISKE